tara:strand:+ start:695 stop:1474 length:780 start_codon:yes stop_codon:yes gene_type:complete
MKIDIEQLRTKLCSAFCQEVAVQLRPGNIARVSLPLSMRDGDLLTAYIKPIAGGWRVSDAGGTMMRLSYEHDLTKFFQGTKKRLFDMIMAEHGLTEDDGDIYVEVSADRLMKGLFSLAQGMTRVEDLGLWTRQRVESTFYEDLEAYLHSFLPAEGIIKDYIVPKLPGAEMYPVDYFIPTKGRPLYLFGVNNKEKAMLVTIVLQHLAQLHHDYDSMVVCANLDDIPKPDRNRMVVAANDIIPSVADFAAIRPKIEHRLPA